MVQLVEAMCHKPESRGFRLPMVSLKFFDIILPPRTMVLVSTQLLPDMCTAGKNVIGT